MGRLDFKLWLEKQQNSIIVYHGTTDDLLPTILSQGLIPDPKVKAWDKDDNTSFYSSSRKSLEGIYVTRNLMTAYSSSGNRKRHLEKGNSNYLIVIISIEPRTTVGDEDDLVYYLRKIPAPNMGRVPASDHEYSAIYLYALLLKEKYNLFRDERDKEESLNELNSWRKAYENNMVEYYEENHINLIGRLRQVLKNGFEIALKRVVSHINKPLYLASGDEYEIIKKYGLPNSTEAENDFLKFADQLTRTLKNPLRKNLIDKSNSTARILTPIGYTGANKIVGIVRIKTSPRPLVKDCVEVIYPKDKSLPEDFINQYQQRIGELTYCEN